MSKTASTSSKTDASAVSRPLTQSEMDSMERATAELHAAAREALRERGRSRELALTAFFATLKEQAPEWRLSLLEHGATRWEAVLARNFDGRADKGPHEIRTGEGETAEEAVAAVLKKVVK